MECQDDGYHTDIQSAFGQGKLGKALGYGIQGSDTRAAGFESEDANSKQGCWTGAALRRHATDDGMAISSGESKDFESSLMAVSRYDSCHPPTAYQDGQETKPRIGQNKLPRSSLVTQVLPTQAMSETLPELPKSDGADDKAAAEPQWAVSSSARASTADSGMDTCQLAGDTTFMIRNIPSAYSQRKLLQEFTSAGFEGLVDFFYLPKGPSTRTNRGFAFCNLLDGPTAVRFYNCFHGKMLQYSKDTIPLELTTAKIQGFEENAKHFLFEKSNNNRSMDAYSRPMFLRPLPSHLQQRLSGS